MSEVKCADCQNEGGYFPDIELECKAQVLDGLMDRPAVQVPTKVCRAIKTLCGAEGRWFIPK